MSSHCKLEEVCCAGISLLLPEDLCSNFDILSDIITPDTWNNVLSDDNRQDLMNLLPVFPVNDLAEKTKTLQMFFMGVNFKFTSPLRLFHQQLRNGCFNPTVIKYRERNKARLKKLCRLQHRDYLHSLLENTIVRRQQYIELASILPPDSVPPPLAHFSLMLSLPCSRSAPGQTMMKPCDAAPYSSNAEQWKPSVDVVTRKRCFREILACKAEAGVHSAQSDDDDMDFGDLNYSRDFEELTKKQKRQLVAAESTLPSYLVPILPTNSTGNFAKDLQLLITPRHNPLDLTDADLHNLLDKFISAKKERRRSGHCRLSEHIQGISLRGVIRRTYLASGKRPISTGGAPVFTRATELRANTASRIRHKKEKHVVMNSVAIPVVREEETFTGEDHLENTELVLSKEMGMKKVWEADVADEKALISGRRYVTLASGTIRNDRPAKPDKLSTGDGQCDAEHTSGKPKLLELSTKPTIQRLTFPAAVDSKAVDHISDQNKNASLLAAQCSLTPACFLCLLRDLICLPSEQRLTRVVLQESLRAWLRRSAAGSCAVSWLAQLPSFAEWAQSLPSAVNFLAGFERVSQLGDFVPYIEYKPTSQAYQWIGAGRDSDAKLTLLNTYWLANRPSMAKTWLVASGFAPSVAVGGHGNSVRTLSENLLNRTLSESSAQSVPSGDASNQASSPLKQEPSADRAAEDESLQQIGTLDEEQIPPPRCPTTWSVQAASEFEKQSFRVQEKSRYEKPHRAFTYRMHGYESVVGPVKGIYSQHSGPNKARGHSLLTPSRPPYVTILALVRDAVARLPNGEGTRADICELLRESQYLCPLTDAAAEGALHSVVSGALDRLHYEPDPCVKYLPSRKLWVYLHRSRDELEFERMHHMNGPGSNRSKKPAVRRQARGKVASKEQQQQQQQNPPPNVSLDPHTATANVDGCSVMLRPEDVLLRQDSCSSSPGKVFSIVSNSQVSKGTTPSSVEQLKSDSLPNNASSTGSGLSTSSSPSAGNSLKYAMTGTASCNVKGGATLTPLTIASSGVKQPFTDVAVASNTSSSAIKVESRATPRTLLSGGLQTFQITTTTGVQTVKLAVPLTTAQLSKGAVLGRLAIGAAGSGTGLVALSGKANSKPLQQTIGQLIQTASGTQFIPASGAALLGTTSPVKKLTGATGRATPVQTVHLPAPVSSAAHIGVVPLQPRLPGDRAKLVAPESHVSCSTGQSAGIVINSNSQSADTAAEATAKTSGVLPGASVMTRRPLTMSPLPIATVRESSSVTEAAPKVSAIITSSSKTSLGNRGVVLNAVAPAVRASTPGCDSGRQVGAAQLLSQGGQDTVLKAAGDAASSTVVSIQKPLQLQQQASGTFRLLQSSPLSSPQQTQATLLGQKLVVTGNKMVLPSGKVVSAHLPQIVSLQQQQKTSIGATVASSTLNATSASTFSTSVSGSSGTHFTVMSSSAALPSVSSSTSTPQQRVLFTGTGQVSNLLNLANTGGKSVVLSGGAKISSTSQQQATAGGGPTAPIVLHGDKIGQVLLSGADKLTGQIVASIGGQQLMLTPALGTSTQQQLILPASAVQGGHITLKGLQPYTALKVIPSGSVVGSSSKTRPMFARIVQQTPPRPVKCDNLSFDSGNVIENLRGTQSLTSASLQAALQSSSSAKVTASSCISLNVATGANRNIEKKNGEFSDCKKL